jgi:uncharacterized membrane protein
VLLELTVFRFAWTFNFDYAHYLLAGVIWMLGWCMVLMAALIWLPMPAIAAFGLIMIAGHNLLDLIPRAPGPPGSSSWLAQFLYLGGAVRLGHDGPMIAVLYSLVPWIGVMAAGYAFGTIMIRERAARDRLCLLIGCGAIALFVALRALDVYGDPRSWRSGPAAFPVLLRFLGTSKYPASLLFLLMTLGPMIALVPLAERARGPVAAVLTVFGRVPLFFYILHIPLIHLAALLVSWLREGSVNPWLFTNHPMANPLPPDGYTWSLPLLYLVFAAVVATLYVPCRWFARVKARRRDGWLSYL